MLSNKCYFLISQDKDFYDVPSPTKSWFQISFKLVKLFGFMKRLHILQLPILGCVSLITVTITSHIFINIFQMVHVHIPVVKFSRANKKTIIRKFKQKIGSNMWVRLLKKTKNKQTKHKNKKQTNKQQTSKQTTTKNSKKVMT